MKYILSEDKIREAMSLASCWHIAKLSDKEIAYSIKEFIKTLTTEEKTQAVNELNKSDVSGSVFDWMKSEVTASMIMGLPDDEYKKGHNDAMRKALGIVKRYKEGNGLFQQ